eukprot:gene30015-33874_t
MKPSMLAKLDQLANRLAELDELLMSEGATSNMDSYRKMTREHTELAWLHARIAQRFDAMLAAGFTPGEADDLRRAMAAWKRHGNLHKYERRLVDGMTARGYEPDFAQGVFEQIKGFSSYGFPESHAASFALLVYVSCWIKHHHPAEFLVAMLNSQPLGFYTPSQLVQDAQRHGVEVRPVDVVHSDGDCTLEAGGAVRLGLRLRKGRFGSRLLVKLAAIFALVGLMPGLLIYVVSYQFVTRSIESWFDVKVEGALSAGVNLARVSLDSLATDMAAKTRNASAQVAQKAYCSRLPRAGQPAGTVSGSRRLAIRRSQLRLVMECGRPPRLTNMNSVPRVLAQTSWARSHSRCEYRSTQSPSRRPASKEMASNGM